MELNKKNTRYNKFLFWSAFVVIIVLVLDPFFEIGFTTSDDLGYYMDIQTGNLWDLSKHNAQYSGRFYFLLTDFFYYLPYLVDNFYFTKIIQYSSLILSFVLFYVVIRKIFKSKSYAIFILLLLFAFLSITRQYHIPIIAYPFYFSFSFSLFLLSVWMLIEYDSSNKLRYLLISVILMAAAVLFYETYLFFLCLLIAYLFIQSFRQEGIAIFKSKSFYKKTVPFIAIIIIYLIVYFVYKEYIALAKYGGITVTQKLNWNNFFSILWGYNKSALPIFTYAENSHILRKYSLLPQGDKHNFWMVLTYSSVKIKACALLVSTLSAVLLTYMKTEISWRKISSILFISLILTFVGHILLAISSKYNNSHWWSHCPGYVTTFYSYFFITLIIGVVFYMLLKLVSKKTWLKAIVISIISGFIFSTSIITGHTNEYFSRAWHQGQLRFVAIDELCKDQAFTYLDDNAVLYMGELCSFQNDVGNSCWDTRFDWKTYIKNKTNKEYNMFDKLDKFIDYLKTNPQSQPYYMKMFNSPKRSDILLVLFKINANSLNLVNTENLFSTATSNDAMLFYYSPIKEFYFTFPLAETTATASDFYIDNTKFDLKNDQNTVFIKNMNINKKITCFRLKSDAPFYTNQFIISLMGDLQADSCVVHADVIQN